ncbi:hypothetical protein IAE19_03620 [Acinetobacter sp. S40]|uniref:hypothetical protein n=1 Tax=unclassified Acinetobacter TaxID=196816 RepID=UPI00190D22AD|nr:MULTISPECIES: hypothetical protein [unclassified Acinetobacter]MBJ9984527.1 hypothetical protein [Acinetobacter sp. S40]MBK0062244.1 hypothetical protein [Acinetobacter sp. S55]MBK0066048.1 hypothetical protein [Acinetobacter sp. S54]
MKKITLLLSLVILGQSVLAAPPERYIRSVEKISNSYNTDMRNFLRSLNPQQTQFTPAQQTQFCGIVNQYVQDLYQVNDQYRQDLPLSYAKMTKQDFINQVLASKEMQILKKYNIQCHLQ